MEPKVYLRIAAALVVLVWLARHGKHLRVPYLFRQRPSQYVAAAGFALVFAVMSPHLAKGWPGLALVLLGATIFGVLGGFFASHVGFLMWAALRRKSHSVPVVPGERPLLALDANDQLDGETRGGRFLVTTTRFVFLPHRYNVQITPWDARYEDILDIRQGGPHLLHLDTAAGERRVLVRDATRELPKLRAFVSAGKVLEKPETAPDAPAGA